MRKGTYSIVARDPATGQLGVAVQSHWFSVGSVVSWARAGTGAVATQSVAEVAYGPRTLDRLAAGEDATSALRAELDADPSARVRQVAVVDRHGRVAVHTGEDCIPYAGHEAGEQFSCQANMMARDTVPGAMAAAYRDCDGPLPDRLLAALRAAEGEGGDIRGRQSAAMVVVPAEGDPWATRVDLRVEDHRDPLDELGRVLGLQRAYEMAGEADELLGAGDAEGASRLYIGAAELAPQSDELLFWAGLSIAHIGDLHTGTEMVKRAAAVNPDWLVLLDRLSPEFAPSGEAVRAELGGVG
jgi:uncharacterized Ntn-hydrolase superfamily protein